MANRSKGSEFERTLSKRLSLWWTHGERDDTLWRSSASGGRATNRAKSGQSTFGHHGDIASTHPISAPLTQVVTIEAKRGYKTYTGAAFGDMLDMSERMAQQTWEAFIEQADTSHRSAGSLSWMLIQKRDNREPCVFFPNRLYLTLKLSGAFEIDPRPFIRMWTFIRLSDAREPLKLKVVGMQLTHFLKHCHPEHVKDCLAHE